MYGGRTYGRAYGRAFTSFNWWDTGAGLFTAITGALKIGWRKHRGALAGGR